MRCPYCQSEDSKVLDTTHDSRGVVRRRRECTSCHQRFTTIERPLLVDDFVLRYDTTASLDGLPPGEGVFLACSFWLADAYVLMNRHADARRLFERLLSLRNDVGLLSEEYDVVRQRLVGNFPQAFSHIALVNTAYNLTQVQKPVEQRAQRDGEAADEVEAQRV